MSQTTVEFAKPVRLYDEAVQRGVPNLGESNRSSGLIARLLGKSTRTQFVPIASVYDEFKKQLEDASRIGDGKRIEALRHEMFQIARRILDKAWNGWLLLSSARRLCGARIRSQSELEKQPDVYLAVRKWYSSQLNEHLIDPDAMFAELDEERAALAKNQSGDSNGDFRSASKVFESYFDQLFPLLHRLADEVRPRLRALPKWDQLDRNVLELLQLLKDDKSVREFHEKRRAQRKSR